MRAFYLIPFVAASVTAAVIDRDTTTNNVRAAAAVDVPLAFKRDAAGPAKEVRAAIHQHHNNRQRRGPPGHKQRLVRRRTNNKRCKAKTSTTAGTQAPTGASLSEDGQQYGSSTQSSSETFSSTTYGQTTPTDGQSSSTDAWATPTSVSSDEGTWGSTSTDSWQSSTTSQSSSDWQSHSTSSTNDWSNESTSAPASSATDGWSAPSSSTDGWSAPSSSTSAWSEPSSVAVTLSDREPSSTTSADSTAATGDTKTGDGALFPISSSNYWTTASGSTPMSDALKVLAGKLPSITSAPDGSQAMVCNYPAGQIGGSSGFSFYASGDYGTVDPTQATDLLFSYSVYFDSNFDWVKGGKLPGVYGGATFEAAKSCSGGNKKDTCFSTRLMWRENGMGEIYDYLPPSATNDYCNTPPKSECNPAFGDSIGRGAWTWQKNAWNTVAMRVKLNDAGSNNGLHTIWLNGEQVLNVPNLEIRLTNDIKFQGIMAQTFYGGGDSSYAPPNEEHAYFKDWSLAILG